MNEKHRNTISKIAEILLKLASNTNQSITRMLLKLFPLYIYTQKPVCLVKQSFSEYSTSVYRISNRG